MSSACRPCRSASISPLWNTNMVVTSEFVTRKGWRFSIVLHLLPFCLGVNSWCEKSQGGPQETLIQLHCHLLNQSHKISGKGADRVRVSLMENFFSERIFTHLNCMTLLCWLNLVMTETSKNGFGSVDTDADLKIPRKHNWKYQDSKLSLCRDAVRGPVVGFDWMARCKRRAAQKL